jgi:hypothetical protein
VLLCTLFGSASVGVIANLVAANNVFVQQAQRNAILAMVSIVPAVLEFIYKRHLVNWAEIFSLR